jgi:hypothetical protein
MRETSKSEILVGGDDAPWDVSPVEEVLIRADERSSDAEVALLSSMDADNEF